jgi:hypothetical protein
LSFSALLGKNNSRPPGQTSQTASSARLDISTPGNSNKPISAILRPFPPEVAFQQLACTSNSNFNINPSKMGKTGCTAGSFPVLEVQSN